MALSNQDGRQDGLRDSIVTAATVVSEGIALGYDGGLAATGAAAVFGVTLHKAASGVAVPVLKSGKPARLRITEGQVIAVGDRLGIGATPGQFSKVAANAGTGILARARGTTTGSGEEYVLADFDCNGMIEPAP